METQELSRRELIRLAIIYSGSRNGNMPAHARRILSEKFKFETSEPEIEAECSALAGETIRRLAQLAPKVAA